MTSVTTYVNYDNFVSEAIREKGVGPMIFSLGREKRSATMTKKQSKARRAGPSQPAPPSTPAAPTAFTREWVLNHPEAFRELSAPPDACPICMEPFNAGRPPLGPITGDSPTTCRHFMCKTCWLAIIANQPESPWKCPICREDVSSWLAGVLRDYVTSANSQDPSRDKLKAYLGKTIMMCLDQGDAELAAVGMELFLVLWPADDLRALCFSLGLQRPPP